ncbi:MAG: porin family protein [Bacteroidales bacterium]|nr:porin family protein [Bacteroidales bacterium]
MKHKFLFVCALAALATSATLSAQEPGETRFGVTGGLNISTANLDLDHSPATGFNLGILMNYGLSEKLYIGTGLKFSQKGVKWDNLYGLHCNPGYLVLPVNMGYRYDLLEAVSVFAEVGLYGGVGVSGKLATDDDNVGFWGDDAAEVLGGKANRLDYGIGAVAGVELSDAFQVRLGYDLSMRKLADMSNSSKGFSVFSIGVAYMF